VRGRVRLALEFADPMPEFSGWQHFTSING
jgi:hypothetical protein